MKHQRRARINSPAILFLLFFWLINPAGYAQDAEKPATLKDILQIKAGTFSCTFDGVKHSFILDLPEHVEGAPLVVMLPGYGNTAEAFRTEVHFEDEANAQGYAVAYVTGAPNLHDPTSSVGWNFESISRGNRDVEFLVSLADYLQENYFLDSRRIYAVGFSNGAFMIHRLAMEAGSTFSAFVSVAGSMSESIWNTRKEISNVGLFQITGEKDPAVPKSSDGSAQYTDAPAIEDVMAYWVQSNGLQLLEASLIGNGSFLAKYGSGEKPQQVWNLTVKDGRHSWPSDRFAKIKTNEYILAFFEAQK